MSWVPGDATAEADAYPFRSVDDEQRMCERFYERLVNPQLPGFIDTAVLARIVWNFRTAKRRSGTLSFSSQVNGRMAVSGTDPSSTALAVNSINTDAATFTFTSSGMTVGYGGYFYMSSGSDYIEVDAEI